MTKFYTQISFFLLVITGIIPLAKVKAQRQISIDFTRNVQIISRGSTLAANTVDGSRAMTATSYSGTYSSGTRLTLGSSFSGGSAWSGFVSGGSKYTLPSETATYDAMSINIGGSATTDYTFVSTGTRFSAIFTLYTIYVSTTNAAGTAGYTVTPQTQILGSNWSGLVNTQYADWRTSRTAAADNVFNRIVSDLSVSNTTSNLPSIRGLYDLVWQPNSPSTVTGIRIKGGGGTATMFLIAASGVPVGNISGTVRADNTDNKIIDGVGTGAAAGFISAVDPDNNMILGTTTVGSNGTYTMTNVSYPTNTSTNTFNLILTTNQQTVGNTLSSSTLNSGWADSFTPGTGLMGTQSNAIRPSIARAGYTDLTGIDISVHPLPTADAKTVNFTSSGATPVQGGQYKMNIPVVGSTTYNSSDGSMLDLSGNVGLNSSAALTTANGTTSSMGFYIPTAISDGGSLIYNGSTVAANTVYPTSSGAVTGYSNSLLYYKFSPTGTAKQYSFTYKAVDQFGFISATAATYTINLAYALPVTYTKELTGNIINKEIVLSWTTGAEINNKAFYVQRSDDATNWSDIGTVASYYSNGTGSGHAYNFTDASPLSGSNYYRLNQVDLDGTPHYGKIIQLNYAYNSNGNIGIYPNPVVDDLNIINLPTTAKNVVIYSIDGRLISQAAVNGTNLQVSVSNLPSAIYFAKIVDKDGKKIQTIKFVKK